MDPRAQVQDPVAIVGMACVFPGAPELPTFWDNLTSGFDAITDVPANRWESLYYDPAASSDDRFYCRRGGFIDDFATFDPLAFGIMPVAAEGAEPDQLLSLKVAAAALRDAGIEPDALAGHPVGVILGRGGYMSVGMSRLVQRVRSAQQLVAALRTLAPGLSEEQLERVRAGFRDQVPNLGPGNAIGLVPNLAASRIANRLDLRGPAYTVDAACASSLLAVHQACRELAGGHCELMLAGGVHINHDTSFWSVFNQLGALSRRQESRPFDERADGLLIGEGVGVVALKRLADAERDGDRVYAVIRGTGTASDGRESSLMQPGADGQLAALRHAWAASGCDPQRIGLLEAHGTATEVGDLTELKTLERFFGRANHGPRAGLGSVKSMIGHTMPAAGAAGLIKAALAVFHGVRPPTLHAERPHPRIADTRFRLIREAEPWEDNERVAAVNAFGFGGINAHVVLTSSGARQRAVVRAPATKPKARILRLAAATPTELLRALGRGSSATGGPARLAILDPSPDKLARARKIIDRGRRWPGRGDVWFSPDGLLGRGGRIAFLYPGVDASFQPRVEDVAATFDLPAPHHTDETELEGLGLGIVEVSRLLDRVLDRLRIRPEALAGHSIGEWTGMITSGMIPEHEIDAFIARCRPGTLKVPGVAFAALGCGWERAEEAIRGLPDIAVSHDNCPHQVLLCGDEESVETVVTTLRAAGVLCQVLPFRSGFHSPLFTDYVGLHREHFQSFPIERPRVALWSATTCEPYPEDPEEIRALAIRHLVRPVRFRELVQRLYGEGFRAFVQVGSGSLVGFVSDTLKGQEHLAITANSSQRSGLDQLRRLAAAIYVEGGEPALEELFTLSEPSSRELTLALGAPLVTLGPELALELGGDEYYPEDGSPIWSELNALTREIHDTRRAVVQALRGEPGRGGRQTTRHTLSVHTVPALRDHCFFHQPPQWPNPADLHPVVPMTMSIGLMMEAAQAVLPERVVVCVRNVSAFKWLVVEPECEIVLIARPLDEGWVEVEMEGFARAEVQLATTYPPAPPAENVELTSSRPAPIAARTLYDDRWMFHGPLYQGVVALGPLGDDGVHGVLEVVPGPGALLDNAGQLFGYWVMATQPEDRLAMPRRIERLDFYGPEPELGARLECDVRIRYLEDRDVVADLQLTREGALWCSIRGWTDHRFDSDARMWDVMLHPEVNLLAEREPDGHFLFDDSRWRAPSRDWLARRYLCQAERQAMRDSGPRRAREWLNGRIAAKDAVRYALWQQEQRPIFPIEITLEHDDAGAPIVRGRFAADLRISLAHCDAVAVARVAEGRTPGIDVERIEPRTKDFLETAFSDAERALIPRASRDEWITRFWCAKEAVAKARRKGLGGNPRRYPVTRRDGERLLTDGLWTETTKAGDYIVAWTEA